ncbi:multiple sugar-binding periplasmic receptor ChvE precursor [mine drainage metagenome]|uniref:Multiple sugar-binding periplasmic receptor ChvE n=1 Tax=mine drainage metagenome TaxID=410659 RepID=A0A1J5QD90_9ZZZZ
MRIKNVAAAAAALTLTLALAACSGSGAGTTPSAAGSGAAAVPAGDITIGVAMPTKTSERWINDGNGVKSQLEALGYKVDLQYADNDIPTQVNQIETMITKGEKLLIIASIDGTALSTQLQEAHSNGIAVIAYDRLIMNSPNVDYYATFDNFKVGVQQATSLLTGLGILDASGKDTGKTGPLNIELFAGSPDDNNAPFFFKGAMSILQPYIDKKVLVVKSGQTDFQKVAILRWDPATAQSRMENLLTSTYADGSKVAGVLSPYDGLSIGILGALKGVGYGTASQPYPIVTGQDAEAASVKSIIAGEQYSTIYKDTRELAKVTVAMADAILKGKTPQTNDTTTYNNGVKVVPSYLLESQIITKDNYKKILIDGGYYTAADLA